MPEVVDHWATQLANFSQVEGASDLSGVADPARLKITTYAPEDDPVQIALIAIDGFGQDWPFDFNTGLDTARTIVTFFFGKKPP